MRSDWRKATYSMGASNCVEVASLRVSSHSMHNGNCVEVGEYRKATASLNHGACVEAGSGPGVVGVRDTKDRGVVLVFGRDTWTRFLERVSRDSS